MSVPPGTRLGPYEIVAKLGEGGMGEVFRGRDTRLGREVAIKFLTPEMRLDERGLARFEREARAASSLSHPNIVTVHDIGVHEGSPYIVMELVRGRTLREILVGGSLAAPELLDLAAQIAEALAKAHAAGIVHRDLKPENVMVTGDGYVKILDFGLARIGSAIDEHPMSTAETIVESEPAAEMSLPGTLLGTLGYMAPEQVRSSRVDFRADQFSFGAILYEMATGWRAFRGASRSEVLGAILASEPPSITALNPTFPPPARWIVERCLAKDAAGRYASTVDLARELRTVRDHLDEATSTAASAAARPAPALPRDRARANRHRWRWIAAAVVLVALGALASPLARRLFEPPIPEEKQVVVLPFRNTSGDAQQQVLCDGLIEMLTSGLTQLERFHGSFWVVPASEVRQTGAESVSDARKVLGATLAVTGSVLRDGERLLVTANLVDAASLRQLRAITFETAFGRITDVQDGLVRRVGEMLDLEIGADEQRLLDAGRTASPDAYAAYLRGRGHLLDYQSTASLDAAVAAFRAALERDPEYALAHAGLGEAYWRRYELERDPAIVVLARKAVERAVAIDDRLAPILVTQGIVHRGTGEPEAALENLRRALLLDPGNALALRETGRTLEQLGRDGEAEAAYRRAIELRPSSWSGHNLLGSFLFNDGRYEEAEAEFRRVTEIAPDNPRGFNNLGGALLVLGRHDRAREALERAMALQPTSSGYSNLGTLEFGLGRHAQAARAFERAIELGARDYRVWRNLGAAQRSIPGEQPRSREAFARALELALEQEKVDPRDLDLQAAIAECEAELGDLQPARERIERVLAAEPAGPEISLTAARIFEKSGSRDAALRALVQAFDAGLTPGQAEIDPDLAGLRADPRYDAIRNRARDGRGGK